MTKRSATHWCSSKLHWCKCTRQKICDCWRTLKPQRFRPRCVHRVFIEWVMLYLQPVESLLSHLACGLCTSFFIFLFLGYFTFLYLEVFLWLQGKALNLVLASVISEYGDFLDSHERFASHWKHVLSFYGRRKREAAIWEQRKKLNWTLLFIDQHSWFCQKAMYWIFAKTVELLGTCKSHHHRKHKRLVIGIWV